MNGETKSPDMSKKAREVADNVRYTAGYHHVFIRFNPLEAFSRSLQTPSPHITS